MDEEILIPDAISTGDLLNIIEQRKFECWLKNIFNQLAQDEEFANLVEEIFDEELSDK